MTYVNHYQSPFAALAGFARSLGGSAVDGVRLHEGLCVAWLDGGCARKTTSPTAVTAYWVDDHWQADFSTTDEIEGARGASDTE